MSTFRPTDSSPGLACVLARHAALDRKRFVRSGELMKVVTPSIPGPHGRPDGGVP